MKTKRWWHFLNTASLGLALTGLAGCQTWVPDVGMTLPSGHYLNHRPQYIPRSPDFPLSRELATMEEQSAAAAAAVAPRWPQAPRWAPPGRWPRLPDSNHGFVRAALHPGHGHELEPTSKAGRGQ